MRTLMKKCLAACTTFKDNPSNEAKEEAQIQMSSAFSKIDKAVKRGVLHRNNGAHKKSQLSSALKDAIEAVPAK